MKDPNKRKLILFGKGPIAQIAKQYFDDEGKFEVVAFTLDKEYIDLPEYEELPMVSFDEIVDKYPPNQHYMFIALSYTDLNKLREKKFHEAKSKGYKLASYISPKCSYLSDFNCGENTFIFEDNTIQPFVEGNKFDICDKSDLADKSIVQNYGLLLPTMQENNNGEQYYYIITDDWKERTIIGTEMHCMDVNII